MIFHDRLFYNPETSNAVKESLLSMQLERLERLSDRKQAEAFEVLSSKIRSELKEYHGVKSKDFHEALKRLSTAEK